QGELAVEATVALGLWNVIDRTAFDQGLGRWLDGLGHLTVLRYGCNDELLFLSVRRFENCRACLALCGASSAGVRPMRNAPVPERTAAHGPRPQRLPVIIGRFRPCSRAQSMAIW